MRNFEVEIPIWNYFFWKNGLFFLRSEAEFFLSPCYHARHLQQFQWFKIFCRMYGLVVMLTIPTSTTMSLINKIAPSFIMSKNVKRKNIEILHLNNSTYSWFLCYFYCSFSLLQILNQKWTKLRPKRLVSIFYNSSTIVW